MNDKHSSYENPQFTDKKVL